MPSRLNWCPEEQNLLKILRQEQNIESWKKIAQVLNQKFSDSSRSGKQCRDRYVNYVRFNSNCPKIVCWTAEQDKSLFLKIQQFGARWVLISAEMPGRSENNLKNRFYGAVRKIMRKINKVQKQIKPKPKKTIKEKQLVKFFQESRCFNKISFEDEQSNVTQCSQNLYNKLVTLAISQQDELEVEQVKKIIKMIHEFWNNGAKINIKNANLQTKETVQTQNTSDTVSASYTKENSFQDQNNVLEQPQMNQELKISGLISWQQPSTGNCNQLHNYHFQNFWSLENQQITHQYTFGSQRFLF